MAVSKQARKRAVLAAGVVIVTAMIAGKLSVPAHAAERIYAAVEPSSSPEASISSDGLAPGPVLLITGLLIISIASFIQSGLKIKLF